MLPNELIGNLAQAVFVGDSIIWTVILGLVLLGLGYVGGIQDWRPRWFFTVLRCGCPASSRVQWTVDGRINGNGYLLRVARRTSADWPAMFARWGVAAVSLDGAMGRREWLCRFTLDETGERLLAEQPAGWLGDPTGDPWPPRLIVALLPELFQEGAMPFVDCGMIFVTTEGKGLSNLVESDRSENGRR